MFRLGRCSLCKHENPIPSTHVIPALTKERDRRIPGACWLASQVQIWWATLSQKHKINLPGEHLGLTSGLQMYMYMNAPIHHGWVQMFVGTHRDTYTRGLTVNGKSEYWFCRGTIISRKVCVTVNTKCPCWASAISAKCCWYWSPEKWRQANRDVSSVTTAALCSLGSSWAFAIYGGVFSAVLCSCLPVFQCRLLSLLGCPCDINLSFLYFLLFYLICLMIKHVLLHSLHKLGKLYYTSFVSICTVDPTYRFHHRE